MKKGLSLLEVLIAIGLMATVILAAAQLQNTGLRASRSAGLIRIATTLANQQLEQMRSNFARLSQGNAGCPSTSDGFQMTCTVNFINSIDSSGNLGSSGSGTAIGASVGIKMEREGRTFLELKTLIAR